MAVDLRDISETELKARGIDWVVCWEIRGRDESVRLKFFFRHGSVLRHFWMEYFHKKFVMPINDIVHLSSLVLPLFLFLSLSPFLPNPHLKSNTLL